MDKNVQKGAQGLNIQVISASSPFLATLEVLAFSTVYKTNMQPNIQHCPVFPLGFFPAVVAGLFPMGHAPSQPKNHLHSELNLL